MNSYLKDYFPGMLASLITTDLRSTIPELVAGSNAVCGTLCNVTTNSTNLVIGNTFVTGNTNPLGIIVYNPNRIYSSNLTNLDNALIYTEGDPLTVITQGDVVMFAEVAVKVGEPVFYRTATNGASLTIPHKVTNVTGTGVVALEGARFMQSITSAGLVVVHIDNVKLGA